MFSPTTVQLLARLREEDVAREARSRLLVRELRAGAPDRGRGAFSWMRRPFRLGDRHAAPAGSLEPCAC